MTRNITVTLLAIALVSCGDEGKNSKAIGDLKASRDSIATTIATMSDEVLEIESAIYDLEVSGYQEQLDSLDLLISEATDTTSEQKLWDFRDAVEEQMNNTKQANILKLREWLKTRNDAFNQRISDIDQELADLEGKVTRINLVSSYDIVPRKFEHYFETYGSIESGQNVSVNIEAPGTIKRIKVDVGETVSKGQTLAILDSDVIQNSVDEIRKSLELATTVFQKQKSLWEQEIGSELQYLQAKNQKESLEQRLQMVEAQKNMYIIKAPFAGVVDEVFYKEGEMGNMITPLLRLVNLQDVYLVADVSEEYLEKVKAGVEVKIKFPTSDSLYVSTINRVGSYVKANNRTFKIYVDLKNEDNSLKPNLLGAMQIKDFEQDSAIVIPTSCIQQDASGQEFVYLIDENEELTYAKKQAIVSGPSSGVETLIVKGLENASWIVLKGARNIKDGQQIKL